MALCLTTACGGHSHHNHNHATHEEHAHQHDGHDHAAHAGHTYAANHSSGEIVIAPEQARAAGIVAEKLTAKPFRQVIAVSGEVLSAQGEEQTVVANVAGIVSFSRPLTGGTQVGKGTALLSISSENMAEGNPVERARIAYEAAQKEYERTTPLVANKIVSEKEYVRIKEAYDRDPGLRNLIRDPYFKETITNLIPAWRNVVATAVRHGVAVPAMSAALSYFDGYTSGRLPANLLQAQRDYFGAHTYERLDAPRGQFFHTNWTGEGGSTTANTYNA